MPVKNTSDHPKMNVCFVMNDLNRGGAERLVLDLATQIQTHENVSTTLVVANKRGEIEPEFAENGCQIVSLDIGVSIKTIPAGISELTSVLQSLDPDIVHSHLSYSHLISRVACTRLSIPHVATYHNVSEKRTLLKRIAERSMRGLSDRIICVSEGVRESYGATPSMDVIYNAIDVREFNRRISQTDTSTVETEVSPDETVFLNVARCVEVKRQQDLIQAVKKMESTDIHLFIVGDGPRRPLLEETVTELGVSDRVTVTGYVDRIEPYYAIADVFVSSSSREGLPSTHIEAMAAKLPIVSTRIPGVTELVKHGENGYLCAVSNPDALTENMERMRANDKRSLGDRGFEIAESEFSIDGIASQHVEQYRSLM